MGTNCALLVADLFLYSHEADFVHETNKISFTHYMDDVLSLNNPTFDDYIDVIYPEQTGY